MPSTPATMRVPSLSLLRAFLKPKPPPCRQIRSKTNWMPREKYANITRLDKLHRRQKLAVKQERLDSQARASQMQPPPFLTSTQEQTPSQPPSTSPLFSSAEASQSRTPSIPTPNSKPNLPYTISRTTTPSHSLPIYESTKSGGSLHITTIRRCSGDLTTLQSHLLSALDVDESYLNKDGKKRYNVKVNEVTKQIVVRGWRGAEVKRWCEMVGF